MSDRRAKVQPTLAPPRMPGRAAGSVTVSMSGKALAETAQLRSQASHHKLKRLPLTVIAENAKGRRTTIHVRVTHLGL